MTTITIYKSDKDSYKGFCCNGHSGYATSGEDIVCAAISVLVITTINSLEVLAKEKMTVKEDERSGFIDCQFNHSINEKSKLLIDSMILGLESIAEQYGKKFLRLKFEEV
jgi:uncharacterized protein YsxB (DUF464 family)